MKIPTGKVVAVDTETTGLDPWNGDRVFTITFCNEKGETGYAYWPVDPKTREVQFNPEMDHKLLDRFFEDGSITKVFHNAKFDIRMLKFSGHPVYDPIEDTYIAARILRSNEPRTGLKALAKKYLDFPDDDEKELEKAVNHARHEGRKNGWKISEKSPVLSKPTKVDYCFAPKDILLRYAVGDVERTMLLWKIFRNELAKDPECSRFYRREMDLQRYIMEMEDTGVRVRMNIVREQIAHHQVLAEKNKLFIEKKMGPNFKVGSDDHLRKYVYETLKTPKQRFTKKGLPSVDMEALKNIQDPVVKAFRNYKASIKVNSTFFEKYEAQASQQNGHYVIHPNFNSVGADTGRFSCSNPNLQNVANALTTRSDVPIDARKPFGPRAGCIWYCFDYKSEEVWIYVDGSKDEKMLDMMLSGVDMHSEVAKFMFGEEAVKNPASNLRTLAKTVFFGILYGCGAKKLATMLGKTEAEAQTILFKYHAFFPNMRKYMDRLIAQVYRDGFIKTAWGRKIFVDKNFAYKAINYYIQGTGADVMKAAIVKTNDYCVTTRISARNVLTIHDELIMEAGSNLEKGFLFNIKEVMEDHQGYLSSIPKLPVDVSIVKKYWSEKEKVVL